MHDKTVLKITGKADRPDGLIRLFKNEALPNIAVTVDRLTTGIDVPRIGNLVFLRRVRSRILYEQMLGRATRLCPGIGKQHFQIFDAVDLYAALDAVNTMWPVVQRVDILLPQPMRELANPAAARLLARQPWTPPQRRWLERIATTLKDKVAVDESTFNQGAWASVGGFRTLDQVFGGRGRAVLGDLEDAAASGLNQSIFGLLIARREATTMRYSTQVKSISWLKTNAAEALQRLAEEREPLLITQNGEAKAVLVDVASYEQQQETLALLKLLALGERDVQEGRTSSVDEVFDRVLARKRGAAGEAA